MHIGIAQRSTHIIALFGGLFFVGSLIACIFVVSEVKQHKERLAEVRATNEHIEQNKDLFESLVTRLDETATARDFLKSRILFEADVIDLLGLIEAIAREQRVTLTTEGLSVEPINESFASLVISVKAEGQYDALQKMLTIAEHLPYQSKVHSVQFTRADGKDDSWVSTYKIQVTSYTKHAQ